MGSALPDKTVLIIGRGSGIARAVTLLARSEGARVVVAGRDRTKLADAYADLGDSGISDEVVDITDDASIAEWRALYQRHHGTDRQLARFGELR